MRKCHMTWTGEQGICLMGVCTQNISGNIRGNIDILQIGSISLLPVMKANVLIPLKFKGPHWFVIRSSWCTHSKFGCIFPLKLLCGNEFQRVKPFSPEVPVPMTKIQGFALLANIQSISTKLAKLDNWALCLGESFPYFLQNWNHLCHLNRKNYQCKPTWPLSVHLGDVFKRNTGIFYLYLSICFYIVLFAESSINSGTRSILRVLKWEERL